MIRKIILILLLCAYAAPAQALCLGLRLQSVPGTATFSGGAGEYDSYDMTEYMQTVNFQVTVPITAVSCDYFVTLGPGSSGNPSQRKLQRGVDTLNYNAYTTAAKTAILKDLATATASQVITGSFPALLSLGQTRNHSFYWTIAPGQAVRAGATRFQDTTLELKVYAGVLLGLYAQVDSKTITFRAKAESNVNLSLVNSGGGFNIGDASQIVDFGDLTSGEAISFDTVVRSNDGYTLTVQSQKQQKLVHQNAPAIATTIPYTFRMNGAAVDLSSGSAVTAATSSVVTSAAGTAIPTQVTIGTLTGAEAPGNYQDIVNITVSAQ